VRTSGRVFFACANCAWVLYVVYGTAATNNHNFCFVPSRPVPFRSAMNMCNSWFERWWLGAATTSERTSRRASTTSGSLASASPISGIPCSKETTPATFLSSSCLGQPAGSETTLSGAFTYACLVLVLVLVLMLALCWFPW